MAPLQATIVERIFGSLICNLIFSASKKAKSIFIGVALFSSVGIYFLYMRYQLPLLRPSKYTESERDLNSDEFLFSKDMINRIAIKDKFKLFKFDPFKDQAFVILHVQKTGGTNFEKRIANDINGLHCNCSKGMSSKMMCDCRRSSKNNEVWLICRYTKFQKHSGWPCGVHADWTELQACVPKITEKYAGFNPQRKYLYITQLRDPINRYISEFFHVKRGATWKRSKHICKGRQLTAREVNCFEGESWIKASFSDFLSCKKNFANNRQTRMLSNLELVDCYNLSAMSQEKREATILNSALENLMGMPFFALLEYPSESQFLFEKTFSLKFSKPWKLYDSGYTSINMRNISDVDLEKSRAVNHMDMKLYQLAKILFFRRIEHAKKVSGEKPAKTIVVKNSKGEKALKNNWKRVFRKSEIYRGRKKNKR